MVASTTACSVGNGSGVATGTVTDPECELSAEAYDLEPSFFGADAVEEQLEIRIQRGSDLEQRSDGLWILVRDASAVRENLLGRAIELSRAFEAPVRMTLYLNDTCPIDRDNVPLHYEAQAGTITFQAIYAPEVDDDDVEIAAIFEGVEFVDPSQPDTRNARLGGSFRFLYTRGPPAQRFP